MSVTPDVSHVEIWPYVDSAAVASESHAATASDFPVDHDVAIVLGTSQSPIGLPTSRRNTSTRTGYFEPGRDQSAVVVQAPAEVLVKGRGFSNMSQFNAERCGPPNYRCPG